MLYSSWHSRGRELSEGWLGCGHPWWSCREKQEATEEVSVCMTVPSRPMFMQSKKANIEDKRHQSVLSCCILLQPHKLFLAHVHSLSFPRHSHRSHLSHLLFGFFDTFILSFVQANCKHHKCFAVTWPFNNHQFILSLYFFPPFSHFVPPPLSLIPSVVQRLGKLAHVAFCLARSSRIWLHIDLTSNPADPDQVSLWMSDRFSMLLFILLSIVEHN